MGSSTVIDTCTMFSKRILLFSVVACIAMVSCKKDEAPEPVDQGYDYFPIKVGTWVEYQVDSMWRDDASNVWDSVSYRLLERIEGTYSDLEGRSALRIQRYVKNVNDEWTIRDVWTATRNTIAAENTEEDVRRQKLSFPVRDARTWNINVYNVEEELKVALREVGSSKTINGMTFPETALVKNTVPVNAVWNKTFEERYAKGVGMVSKLWVALNTQNRYIETTQQFVTERQGFRLTMAAVAHGTD